MRVNQLTPAVWFGSLRFGSRMLLALLLVWGPQPLLLPPVIARAAPPGEESGKPSPPQPRGPASAGDGVGAATASVRTGTWNSSRIHGTPEPPPPYTAERVFPEVTFKNPVFLAQEPGSDRIWVAELAGKVYAFSPARPAATRQLVLETGRQIYAFSFHPRFAENGQIFVFSPRDPQDKSEKPMSRVSRFTAAKSPPPRTIDPATEEVIIEWPAGGHNGGEALIGPDGYLYVSTGDGTSGSDPNETGQGVDDLFSVILRLDVERPAPGKPYAIPPDNPFVKTPGARPEVWAHGFRNPWRISFDSSGRLWCGDVGQDLWEMIWLVERGGNYGWSVQEGSHPFHPHKKQGPGPIAPPVIEHHHSECRSITGGYVYSGAKHPELDGYYFYGDYEYGMVWALKHDGQRVVDHRVLADTPLRIPTFAVTRDGRILLVDHPSGELYELVRRPASQAVPEFPRRLSETGLFASTPENRWAEGVIGYSVNAPQWLDHAHKERFLALPGDSKITFVETSGNARTWGFADGTVAAETISLATDRRRPADRRRLETRILVKQQNHWLGYSYLWNEQQTDAVLVESQGRDLPLAITDADGAVQQQTWRIPSRNECMVCHSRAAAFVLGLRTEQMNRVHSYGEGVSLNQLAALDAAKLFDKPLGKSPEQYLALPDPGDSTADVGQRARAYLHVNCSVCHVADGGGNARIVLKHDIKLAETNLVDQPPMHGTFGLEAGKLVVPGDPFRSVLLYRLAKLGRGRMPHVGARLTDQAGLELIHDWILALPPGGDAPKPEKAPPQETPPVRAAPPADRPQHPDYLAAAAALRGAASPDARRAELSRQLGSTRGSMVLAWLVGQRPEWLEPPLVREIVAAARASQPATRDLFERFLPEAERTKLLGEAIAPDSLLRLAGDVAEGRRLFHEAAGLQCRNCHQIAGAGGKLGPDLSQVGRQNDRRQLLDALLNPSRKVDPKFVAHLLVTDDGRVFTGLIAERSGDQIVLDLFQQGKVVRRKFAAAQVESVTPQEKSLMPDRLLRDLTAQQAADLLSYLESLK